MRFHTHIHIHDDDEFENKHPRAKGGKFGKAASRASAKTKALHNQSKPKSIPELRETVKAIQTQIKQMTAEKKSAKGKELPERTKKQASAKTSAFELDKHLSALTSARSEGEFASFLSNLTNAKPKNDDLRRLLSKYTGRESAGKSYNRELLLRAIQAEYNGKQRVERREKIASETLPI